MATTPL